MLAFSNRRYIKSKCTLSAYIWADRQISIYILVHNSHQWNHFTRERKSGISAGGRCQKEVGLQLLHLSFTLNPKFMLCSPKQGLKTNLNKAATLCCALKAERHDAKVKTFNLLWRLKSERTRWSKKGEQKEILIRFTTQFTFTQRNN